MQCASTWKPRIRFIRIWVKIYLFTARNNNREPKNHRKSEWWFWLCSLFMYSLSDFFLSLCCILYGIFFGLKERERFRLENYFRFIIAMDLSNWRWGRQRCFGLYSFFFLCVVRRCPSVKYNLILNYSRSLCFPCSGKRTSFRFDISEKDSKKDGFILMVKEIEIGLWIVLRYTHTYVALKAKQITELVNYVWLKLQM